MNDETLLRSVYYSETRDIEPVCALDPLLLIPRIEYIGPILSLVQRRHIPVTLVILDMINFHSINDKYDYATGDLVLAKFILLLRKQLPKESIALRFRHGDEFLFFVPRLKHIVDEIFVEYNEYCKAHILYEKLFEDKVTVSFRFASIEIKNDSDDALQLLNEAESELRKIKDGGSIRNK